MGRNILVVEDDKNISDLIHMYLVKEGFDVRIAGDGGKALEEFQKKEPDLILLVNSYQCSSKLVFRPVANLHDGCQQFSLTADDSRLKIPRAVLSRYACRTCR